MFNTISISELQKAPARAFKQTKSYSYVLSNNKKVWMLLSENLVKALEESWILEQFEDLILSSSKFDSERNEVRQIISSWDYSSCINFDGLCKLS
jgi:hypothetical protein